MKICFLGFGRRGKTLYGHLMSLPNVSVVGVFDPISVDSSPVTQYHNARSMLAKCNPDLVIDASPPKYRFKNILLCNDLKVPLVCEKPLLFSAKEVVALEGVKIPVYPAYQLNFDAEINKFFELASKNKIQNVRLSQQVNLNTKGWRAKRGISGGGVLADNGAHLINLSVKQFGLPVSVFAAVSKREHGIDSIAEAFLWYKGFLVTIGASWHSPVGKETALTINTDSESVRFVETNQSKLLWVSYAKIEGEWTYRVEETWFVARGLDRNIKANPLNKTHKDATLRMLEDILHDISATKRRSAMATKEFRVALQTSEVIEALYRSIKKGQPTAL